MPLVIGESANQAQSAVTGTNTAEGGPGVWGQSQKGRGVVGVSSAGVAVWGDTDTGRAVVGVVHNPGDGVGVWGQTKGGKGVFGGVDDPGQGVGVWGATKSGRGVVGVVENAGDGVGVWGETQTGRGVVGVANDAGTGIGVFGKGGKLAGFFEGDVAVTGHIEAANCSFNGDVGVTGNIKVDRGDIILTNADCAEDFDIANAGPVEPGTVMVLADDGALQPSQSAYDKRVAGVVSGAGNYKPGIVLDKRGSQPNRKPVALLGKVYCKVDATFAPVEIGDLLTTSPTPGHAMKTTDQSKAFGAVIGKALRPFSEGRGLIPILVALQ